MDRVMAAQGAGTSTDLGQKPLRVLLIEDNPGDARLLREMLSEEPLAPVAWTRVERVSEALERLGRESFDVILSDLSLPDSRGLETFQTVAARAPDTPIVVLTGLNDHELAVKAVQAGAQDYLIKGQVTGDVLARSLRYAIERQEASHYRALAMEREHFDAAIAQMSDGILLVDSQWRITAANQAAGLLLNLPSEGGRGMSLEAALSAFTLSVSLEELKADQERVTHLEIMRAHTQPPLYLAGRLTRLAGPGGTMTSAVLTLRDVTAERRAQHLQTNFFTAVSHKLRTPLTVLSLHLDLWKRMDASTLPRGFPQALAACDVELKKLIDLVAELLEFKELNERGIPVESQPVEVPATIEAASTAVRKRHPSRQLALTTTIQPEARRLSAGPEQVRQVLEKLLDNAMKFAGKPQVRVRIEARREGDWVEFVVRDDGPGIPHEAVDRIVRGFSQVEDKTTGNVPGLGVGLYLASRIVEAYGGQLSIRSTLGQDTSVSFRFPAADDGEAPTGSQ